MKKKKKKPKKLLRKIFLWIKRKKRNKLKNI